jgi:glycogen operon protein
MSADTPDYEAKDDSVFVVFNRSDETARVILPNAPSGQSWMRALDTSADPVHVPSTPETDVAMVTPQSVTAFVLDTP